MAAVANDYDRRRPVGGHKLLQGGQVVPQPRMSIRAIAIALLPNPTRIGRLHGTAELMEKLEEKAPILQGNVFLRRGHLLVCFGILYHMR